MSGNSKDSRDEFEALQALARSGRSDETSFKSQTESLDALMNDNERARDQIKEERFVWILALIVLADLFFMIPAQNFGGPLVVGALELVLIVVLAQKCGIDQVLPFIDRVLSMVARTSADKR